MWCQTGAGTAGSVSTGAALNTGLWPVLSFWAHFFREFLIFTSFTVSVEGVGSVRLHVTFQLRKRWIKLTQMMTNARVAALERCDL